MSGRLVDVVVEDEAWLSVLPDLEDVAETGAQRALDAAGLAGDSYEIALLACDDQRIAALNADFRGKPKATNVLSWPAHDLRPDSAGGQPAHPPKGDPITLGDVAIARQTCLREAKNASIPLKTHATHLILHAVLHLLGYDHVDDADAQIMEALESRAMISAGFPDPYERLRDGPA